MRAFESLESRALLASWGLDAIDAPAVWDQGYHGQGVVVAVIDSGIDAHSDLVSGIWRNQDETINKRDDDGNGFIDDVNGWNFVDDDNSPIRTNSHGTHVSGTIAASRNQFGTTGVAYEAKIMPLRIFTESGTGSTSDIASAIRYAVDNGAHLINLSIGGAATRNVTSALEYAAQKNVLVVAASGNDGARSPTFPAISSVELTNVISVGAHDESFSRTLTSNRVGRTGAIQVDAPGEDIMSTTAGNEYAFSSGTSTAAAHVAGIAALAISANPDLSARDLRDALTAGVSRRVLSSDSIGAVNAFRTVRIVTASARSESDPSPDFNKNGETDLTDFLILAQNFGKGNAGRLSGDADGDGKVLFSDFVTLSQSYAAEESVGSRRQRGAKAISTDAHRGIESVQNEKVVDTAVAEIVDEEPAVLPQDILLNLFSSSR